MPPQLRSVAGKTVLVTGGAGFIGSHLVDHLLDSGAEEVVVIDSLFLGSEANLAEALRRGAVLYKDDAERASALDYIFAAHPIEVVFNCASKPLDFSLFDPSNCFGCSVNIVANLLELLRKERYATLCHFSSSEVYGRALYEPVDERHPVNPLTPFGAGKLAADKLVESYVHSFGVDALIVRPFNNYGPRQNFRPPFEEVIPHTVALILDGLTPEIWGDGNQGTDFIHVSDTVAATLKAFEVLPRGQSVNLASHDQVDAITLIRKVAELMGCMGEIVFEAAGERREQTPRASNAKAKSLFDFRLTPFDEGLRSTVEWYLEAIPRLRGE